MTRAMANKCAFTFIIQCFAKIRELFDLAESGTPTYSRNMFCLKLGVGPQGNHYIYLRCDASIMLSDTLSAIFRPTAICFKSC